MQVLKQEQFLPVSISAAWDFFSTPENLNMITPEDLTFEVTSPLPEKIYEVCNFCLRKDDCHEIAVEKILA